jgi:DNA polymerase-3 subunit gamma/tau
LAAGDIHAMLAVANTMEARSLSFDSALQELATLFHRIALLQFAPQAILDQVECERLAPYAERFDAEYLQLCYQILIHGRDELALAPDEAAGFTMTLLRLHAFRPGGNEKPVAGAAAPLRAAPAPVTSVARPVTAVPPAPTFTAAPAAAIDSYDWHGLVATLPLTGMVRQLAQHCERVSQTDYAIILRMAPTHKHLQVHQDKLRAELAKHFGRALTLEIRLDEPAGETPKARADTEKRERQERAIAAIESDPFVREACDLFDASIDESTIKPL